MDEEIKRLHSSIANCDKALRELEKKSKIITQYVSTSSLCGNYDEDGERSIFN
jgi:hypothetical protein